MINSDDLVATLTTDTEYDPVKKPQHYGQGTIECIKYIEDFLKQQTDRVDNVIKKFPNQYTYLKDWYEGWTVD